MYLYLYFTMAFYYVMYFSILNFRPLNLQPVVLGEVSYLYDLVSIFFS